MKYAVKCMAGIACLLMFQQSHAGTMGVEAVHVNTVSPFISIEGSGTWTVTRGVSFDTIVAAAGGGGGTTTETGFSNSNTSNSVNPFGGRLAGGLTYLFRDNAKLIAEAGWNYFGDASRTSNGETKYSANGSIYGVDLLMGASYNYYHIDWFGEFGALFQQVQYQVSSPLIEGSLNGDTLALTGSLSGAQLNVMPEIKVGGIYNYNDNWAFSLAYMHAFGGNPSLRGNISHVGDASSVSGVINSRNPYLNSILLGLRYYVA